MNGIVGGESIHVFGPGDVASDDLSGPVGKPDTPPSRKVSVQSWVGIS